MRTAPGVSPSDFAEALQEFAAVVGKDWVFTTDEDLDLYRDAYSPLRGQPDERVASAAVAPLTAEQVQAVVRIANRYKVPLYPISTGKNLGYGGSAPVYSGSVVLDLKRMNRIIEVNDRNHYAIVEPGVSYFDLYRYIQEKGLKVWIDVPDPGWGSPIGNALDHGLGYLMPEYRNHFDSHCGMEIVLPNGEMLRTGMGALPKSETWQQFKMGFGPWIDGMFSQSNFGVVTKMGFWLMPEPEAVLTGSVVAPRFDDLHALVELINYVESSRLATGMTILASPLLALGGGDPHQLLGNAKTIIDSFYDGPPRLAPEHAALLQHAALGYSPALEHYGLENNIGYWQANFTFYGPPKVVLAQWDAVCALASASLKDARFGKGELLSLPLTDAQKATMHPAQLGIPSLEFFAMGGRSPFNPHPSSGHLWFAPIIPRTGQAILDANRVFQKTAADLKLNVFDSFSLPSCFVERAFIFVIPFSITEDPDLNRHFIDAYRELVRVGAEQGWGEYRAPAILQDQVMAAYSYNGNILRRFNETLKDAIDPSGILAPGRYGIWPKHMREARQ